MSDVFIEIDVLGENATAAVETTSIITGTCLVVRVASGAVSAASVVAGSPQARLVLTGAIVVVNIVTGEFNRESSKTNWVAWSKIGEARIELDRINDSGIAPMRWQGTVYRILPMANFLLIYGSNGITQMSPVREPAPTFGFKEIAAYGIKSRYAVAGDQDIHYFISTEGVLCKASEAAGYQTLKIERLGYEEFLSSLGVNTVMFYAPDKEELYISDGSIGYILTSQGLGGGYPNLTGVALYSEGERYVRPEVLTQEIEFKTNIIDLGIRDVKQLKRLTLRADYPDEFQYAVECRFRVGDAWTQTEWYPFDLHGEGYPWVSGSEFRILVRATSPSSDVEIQDLILGFQLSDLSLKGVIQ